MKSLNDDEVLRLLQKKLKQPTYEDCRNLISGISWTPLAVELAAAALNKNLISMSKFVASLKSGKVPPLTVALSTLSNSLNSYEKNLLYFVSSFRPLEVPSLWFRAFSEWRNDDEEEFDELEHGLSSLREFSLLVEVSHMNVYKMNAGVLPFIAGMLQATDRQSQILKNIKAFVDSRKYIPNHRLVRFRKDDQGSQKILTLPRS